MLFNDANFLGSRYVTILPFTAAIPRGGAGGYHVPFRTITIFGQYYVRSQAGTLLPLKHTE